MTNKSLKELLDNEYWAIRAVDRAEHALQCAQERLSFKRQKYERDREDYVSIQDYIDAEFKRDRESCLYEIEKAKVDIKEECKTLKAIRNELKEYFAMIMAIDEEE